MAENIKWKYDKRCKVWHSGEYYEHGNLRMAIYQIRAIDSNTYEAVFCSIDRGIIPLPDMAGLGKGKYPYRMYRTLKDAKQACDTFQHHYRVQGGWE